MTSVANGKEELNVQPLSHQSVLSPVVEPAGTICRTLNHLERFFTHPFRKKCLFAEEGGNTLLSPVAGEEDGGQPRGFAVFISRVNGGSSTSGCKMPFSLF